MADSFKPLIKGVIAALKADTPISDIVVARIFSDVPQNQTFPYIVVTIQSAPFDTKTSNGMEHSMQVSAFSRSGSVSEVGDIRSAVYDLLHKGESNVTLDSGTLVNMLFSGVGFVAKEPDGVTWQGTMQFDVVIE